MCFKPNLPANLLLFFDICKRKGDFLLLFYYIGTNRFPYEYTD